MKTHDEIKKGHECLDKMQFFMGQRAGRELWMEKPHDVQEKDIESFNRNVDTVRNLIQQLETKCHQLERERDAAVADIPRACGYCKWFEINSGGNMTECHNPNVCRNISGINTGWEWRGVEGD